MGSLFSKDGPNPVSGLTKKDVKIVQRTWDRVFSRAEVYGMELFIRFFRADPETKKLFKTFNNLSDSEMKETPQFRAHVFHFMTAFNMTIRKLKNPEVVVPMFERLGQAHKRIGVPQRHFETLKTVLVEFLMRDMKLKRDEMQAWARFVTFAYSIIYPTLK